MATRVKTLPLTESREKAVPSLQYNQPEIYIYVPEAYNMYFIWRWNFFNCSVPRPNGWGENCTQCYSMYRCPPLPLQYHWPLEGTGLKLMYIKLPMYLFFIWRMDLLWFWCGQINYAGHWKGWALKSRFFGPKWPLLRFLSVLGAKKSPFQGSTLPMALVEDSARIKASLQHTSFYL